MIGPRRAPTKIDRRDGIELRPVSKERESIHRRVDELNSRVFSMTRAFERIKKGRKA